MRDVSGVQWAVQGGVVGGYGPLFGRQDQVPPTPDSFSPTPASSVPAPSDETAPEEVPDARPVSTE